MKTRLKVQVSAKIKLYICRHGTNALCRWLSVTNQPHPPTSQSAVINAVGAARVTRLIKFVSAANSIQSFLSVVGRSNYYFSL